MKRRAVREEVGAVVSGVGKGDRDVGILDSLEISVSPEILRDVRNKGVVESEEAGGCGREMIGRRGAH